ncbi:MAG: hypothetical protein DRR06_12565, partial [Gammaproteobacteria bacterium]
MLWITSTTGRGKLELIGHLISYLIMFSFPLFKPNCTYYLNSPGREQDNISSIVFRLRLFRGGGGGRNNQDDK